MGGLLEPSQDQRAQPGNGAQLRGEGDGGVLTARDRRGRQPNATPGPPPRRGGETPTRTNRLIHEAVRAITYSIEQLSQDLDITYVTLFNYRRGRRTRIPRRFLSGLSRVLRRQSKRLLRLAGGLDSRNRPTRKPS